MKFIAIIPSRYASTRLPGKPLVDICGKPMIQRVWERVRLAVEDVVIATDDKRIMNTVESFGGKSILTSSNHRSGTDRCHEAFMTSKSDADVIINVQGDEPFIDPEQIQLIKSCFSDPTVEIATLVRPFNPKNGYDSLADPNTPKVVVDNEMNAIYFSRSVIPFIRNSNPSEWICKHRFYTHIGMYAYRASILEKITELPQSSLELAESLEQLRWIENGIKIRLAVSNHVTIGVDTIADLELARKFAKEH